MSKKKEYEDGKSFIVTEIRTFLCNLHKNEQLELVKTPNLVSFSQILFTFHEEYSIIYGIGIPRLLQDEEPRPTEAARSARGNASATKPDGGGKEI